MSRSQQSQVVKTGEANSSADQAAASGALSAENAGIGNYEGQLAKFAASNPYTQGGQYDTAVNQKLSGVADAGSAGITDNLQTQALRTGQNLAGANATAAEAARANLRDLSAQEGQATQTRIGDQAGYGQQVLGASEIPAQLRAQQYATSLGAANNSLSTAGDAAKTPGFWDTLGNGVASSLGQVAVAGIQKCWIAAELYGGWHEPRTMLIRQWLGTRFAMRPYGPLVLKLYTRYGERTARAIRRWPILRGVFLPIFNAALTRAESGV